MSEYSRVPTQPSPPPSPSRRSIDAAFEPTEDADERAPLFLGNEPDSQPAANPASNSAASPAYTELSHLPAEGEIANDRVVTSPTPSSTEGTGVDERAPEARSNTSDAGEKEEEEPPSYDEVAADAVPSYWDTTLFLPGYEPSDVYIDGIPVGTVYGFCINSAVSIIFPFVGFLMTYIMATSHAARFGSQVGLSATLIERGITLWTDSTTAGNEHAVPDETESMYQFIAAVSLVCTGSIMFLLDVFFFLRVLRMKRAISRSTNETNETETPTAA
ncbi:heavy metal ion homeostasis protein [Schizosaccharomyces japonicus yFS275]|uniref:Heavy metal ion homeostasis protein n=1 Tax=Schizosaccharomyces japonicus (strain yFS275 / FY16936) TaxID=402676 RepID=B6JY68_SCHJY|nr:heavy metal ion homeostasis protein [Schizosaccharomyces japonicus yFS275]EEB06486.2 heavy metal ion homeostasis protein [Schizosaccharomyces japonicus yFS275]